ncbi:TatD family hydrolase [Pusillimonas sp. CC-YST705]|uniref:TatD family hydrolase n=1 Tax=Mesopusillimonas faecipullorum TaxID=2755040 RepID=A0ABS8CAG8_9BURK|nr:TatD family hydrolase [Mesopusillimonas faecipullorum]MCB5362983.1 TatD family hydrolase [Mesopusillimonas faecipullorum]
MLIDTHCHLDAAEFDADRTEVVARAQRAGVKGIVIPAVMRANFGQVAQLAASFSGGAYALGIHPLYVPQAQDADLQTLEQSVEQALSDPRFVGIGEIGLDFFVPELKSEAMRARQTHFYTAQLAIAQRHGLPVILHVRRSQDEILKQLRRYRPVQGIAHAFNGSVQQAEQFLSLGFALGFGGAMTFERALQIRRLAANLPPTAWVLETDAPDIAPAWLPRQARNEPAELPDIAKVMAQLRELSEQEVVQQSWQNAKRVLPRLEAAQAG